MIILCCIAGVSTHLVTPDINNHTPIQWFMSITRDKREHFLRRLEAIDGNETAQTSREVEDSDTVNQNSRGGGLSTSASNLEANRTSCESNNATTEQDTESQAPGNNKNDNGRPRKRSKKTHFSTSNKDASGTADDPVVMDYSRFEIEATLYFDLKEAEERSIRDMHKHENEESE